MAVFRVEKTRDYTVMSNYHLRDKNITLKAKGLLSQMLSLPDSWNYTLEGLAQINKEKVDAIRAAVRELETAGYILRSRERDEKGRLGNTVYVIYERPQNPTLENPTLENPTLDKPILDFPTLENPRQLNKDIQNTDLSNKDLSSIDSIPSGNAAELLPEQKRKESMIEEIDIYRDFICDNIDYDVLKQQVSPDELDEIVELIVETVCSTRRVIRVAGSDWPHDLVKNRLLKLNSEHIKFVMNGINQNTTKVRNMKQYLLTSLFNAYTTINNSYSAQVNHDMANDDG